VLFEAAQKRARSLGLTLPFTRQTLPAHLAAIGYSLPGENGRHTIKPYIPGHGQVRVLRIPIPTHDDDAEAPPAKVMGGIIARPPRIPPVAGENPSPRFPAVQKERDGASGVKNSDTNQGLSVCLPALPAVFAKNPQACARAREDGAPAEKTAPPPPAKVRSRRASLPEKPTAIVDVHQLVIVGDGGIAGEDHPACLDLRKNRRKGGNPAHMGQILDWARERGVGRLVFAQAWAEAAGLKPGGSAGSKWTLAGAGRSQRASCEAGGAAIEVYFPDGKAGDADAVTIAHALARVRDHTGRAGRRGFQYRGGVQFFWQVADALARDGRAALDQTIAPRAFPAPAHALPEPPADLGFIRAPTEAERAATHCVVIDANSQYLRAMGGHRFGIGDPERHAAPAFDPKAPGYWKATWRGATWPATLPAPGWPLAQDKAGWLMTETVQLLAEAGAQIDIEEAWLWEAGPALNAVQTRLRDALYALKAQARDDDSGIGLAEALDMIKQAYKQGVGSMSRREDRSGTEPNPHHRPHWRHAIIARSTALILRDLWRAKAHPVAIAVDGLAFLTAEPPEAFLAGLGLKIGERLGQYQPRPGPAATAMLAALGAWEAAGAPARNHPTRAGVIGLITGHAGE
jgi:hypothetical protein